MNEKVIMKCSNNNENSNEIMKMKWIIMKY